MAAQRNILELQNVKRAFGSKVILTGVNLAVGFGELVALYGPSGSGKSTLLNLVGAIDRPSEGTIHLAGRDVSRMWEMNRTKLRRTQIGFIFQNYPLIAAYSAAENIDMSLRLKGIGLWERRRRIKASLEAVGLSDHARRLPDQLSGGQQQRVAIARVLALHPTIILADEPTSGLDTRTARRVMKIFQGLAEAEGTAFLVVSHDIDLTERFMNRAYDLRDGQLALRPPVGTVVDDHDALEARRREVNAYSAKHDVNDDWDADEPEFLAELPRDDAIRLGDPEFLRGVTVDDLPAESEHAETIQEIAEIVTQDAEPEIADTPTPLFTEIVEDVPQTQEQKDVQNIAEMLNDAQDIAETPNDERAHQPVLDVSETPDDVSSLQGADSGLTDQVEDVVEDTDTTDDTPDDQADHRPS